MKSIASTLFDNENRKLKNNSTILVVQQLYRRIEGGDAIMQHHACTAMQHTYQGGVFASNAGRAHRCHRGPCQHVQGRGAASGQPSARHAFVRYVAQPVSCLRVLTVLPWRSQDIQAKLSFEVLLQTLFFAEHLNTGTSPLSAFLHRMASPRLFSC